MCYKEILHDEWAAIAQSVQRIATVWTVLGSNPVWARFSAPVQTGPLSLLFKGYCVFPGVKAAGE